MRSQGAAYSLFKYCRDLHSTLHISRLTISTEVRHMFHLLIFQIRTMSANCFDFRVDLTYLNISSKCHECWWPGFLEISSFLLMKWQEFLDNRFQLFSILRNDKFEFSSENWCPRVNRKVNRKLKKILKNPYQLGVSPSSDI